MDSSITVKMTLNNHRSIAKIYTRELLQRSLIEELLERFKFFERKGMKSKIKESMPLKKKAEAVLDHYNKIFKKYESKARARQTEHDIKELGGVYTALTSWIHMQRNRREAIQEIQNIEEELRSQGIIESVR